MPASSLPILEFDSSPASIIEPDQNRVRFETPLHAVICFFREVVEKVASELGAREIGRLECEMGTYPVFEADCGGRRLAFVQGGVGAPLAAGWLEELIAHGSRAFVAVGGAGALLPELTLGHLVVPTSAVRDEGTSYHYLPASREVAPTDDAIAAITATLDRHGIPHVVGKTWTTDGFYRETRGRTERRVAEGCLTVEMEAAAFFAVARFRGVSFGQMLYAGDDLSGEVWDGRGWNEHAEVREVLFHLAAEAVLAIDVPARPTGP